MRRWRWAFVSRLRAVRQWVASRRRREAPHWLATVDTAHERRLRKGTE